MFLSRLNNQQGVEEADEVDLEEGEAEVEGEERTERGWTVDLDQMDKLKDKDRHLGRTDLLLLKDRYLNKSKSQRLASTRLSSQLAQLPPPFISGKLSSSLNERGAEKVT